MNTLQILKVIPKKAFLKGFKPEENGKEIGCVTEAQLQLGIFSIYSHKFPPT